MFEGVGGRRRYVLPTKPDILRYGRTLGDHDNVEREMTGVYICGPSSALSEILCSLLECLYLRSKSSYYSV